MARYYSTSRPFMGTDRPCSVVCCLPGFGSFRSNFGKFAIGPNRSHTALKVVKLREQQRSADNDQVNALITDAYATVAIAYRRASAAYTVDKEMQQLGTAAIHLVTIATSYMTAQADEADQK